MIFSMVMKKGRRVAIAVGAVALVVIAVAVWLGWPRLVSWYRFTRAFEALGRNAQGYQEYRHRATGIVMVLLPGGTYWMGAQKEDPKGRNYDPDAGDDEGPVHEVTLRPFLVAKYEVTQAQWKTVMEANPSHFTGDENRPVEGVFWDDIQDFEAKTGLALPTEAQWEYACRCGTTTVFAGKLDDLGWFDGNSGGTTHPVGTKAANGFGLHDLHGNVWEWCEDVYDEAFYGKPEAAGPDAVSTTSFAGHGHFVRGGSWSDDAGFCRSASRIGDSPTHLNGLLGFRPVAPTP